MAAALRACKLADINTGKVITGYEACRPGRPARLTIDKYKLHYVVHYMHRGLWDELVPEENEEELGKIEAYHCNMCPRRFRNNHSRKSYPGRGSIMCHLATEHGQLLKAMQNDDRVDMTEEINAIDEYEKTQKNEQGSFLELGIPDVPDNELYAAKESFMWKIDKEQKQEEAEKNKTSSPSKDEKGDPKIVPFSKTELAERGVSPKENNRQRSKTYECPHCDDCKNNADPSKLRLHVFLHYKDRWENRLDKLEKGQNCFYCDSCPKRKQLKGADEAGAKTSAICHFAIQHHELRTVLNKDERLPFNFVKDLYSDIDLKEGESKETKLEENTTTTSPVKTLEPTKVSKAPEPTRGRRPKSARRGKDAWMSSDEEKEDEDSSYSPPQKKVNAVKSSAGKKKKN